MVIAVDTQVDKSRFVGKRLYSTSIKAAIHDAGKVFDTAWAEATPYNSLGTVRGNSCQVVRHAGNLEVADNLSALTHAHM